MYQEIQRDVEHLFSKRNIKKAILQEVHQSPVISQQIDDAVKAVNEWLQGDYYPSKNARLKQLALLDIRDIVEEIVACTIILEAPVKFTQVVGQLQGILGFSEKLDGIKTIAELLGVVRTVGIYDITKANKQASMMVKSEYATPETLKAFIHQTMYLPPMVCPPRILRTNYDSGYLTKNGNLILGGSHNFHEDDICLDSLNKFNQVPLSLDVEMLRTYSEIPSKVIENPEAKEQWEKMARDSIKIYVDLVSQGNEFWLTHKVDKRGRTYAQGYHVSTQGNQFKKAIVNLAEKELIDGV